MQLRFLILFILLSFYSYAQPPWVYDIDIAKKEALKNNKFILVDFTAKWCKPCKLMDKKVWNSRRMKALSDDFVFLKVDLEKQPMLAYEFKINPIPAVFLIDASQIVLWKKIGFNSNSKHIETFKIFPSHTKDLSKHLKLILYKRNSSVAYFNLAIAYQEMAKELNNKNELKTPLLKTSNKYLEEVLKKPLMIT